MARKVNEYEGKDITLRYEAKRCIHAEECVQGLPGVFDPEKRPWIQPDLSGVEELAAVVQRCPTGALTFERKDGGGEEAAPDRNQVQVAAHGPLYVHGDVEITSADGSLRRRETRAALCRCGGSGNKPFCDNRHREIAFQDPGEVAVSRMGESPEADTSGRLRIKVTANGPLLLEGPVELRGAGDVVTYRGSKGALCRCGASASKPYCDGSHVAIGFEAD